MVLNRGQQKSELGKGFENMVNRRKMIKIMGVKKVRNKESLKINLRKMKLLKNELREELD